MKLSTSTIEVLKNYSSINTGLVFRKGNILRTMSEEQTILAQATIEETMPSDFGIHELNQLLAILSLHKEGAEVNLEGNNFIIQGLAGRSKITYRCCDEAHIKTPPKNNITVPSQEATFLLTDTDLTWIMKAGSVLGCPNVAVVGKDGKLALQLLNGQNDAAHTDTITIDTYNGPDCFLMFKLENWKLLPGSYKVTVSAQGVAHFEHTSRKLEYWIALESRAGK